MKNINFLKNKGIDIFMNWNPKFSAYIEYWINGGELNDMFVEDEFSEGDLVRAFKRTIDVLRQFCTISGIPDEVSYSIKDYNLKDKIKKAADIMPTAKRKTAEFSSTVEYIIFLTVL